MIDIKLNLMINEAAKCQIIELKTIGQNLDMSTVMAINYFANT